jgi:hypothetical protein
MIRSEMRAMRLERKRCRSRPLGVSDTEGEGVGRMADVIGIFE